MHEIYIGHLEVESPWGNAGGLVKKPEDVEQMARTGVGWIEAGSYTLEPRAGNGAEGQTIYYHSPKTGETFNALGMPNAGMDRVEEDIPEMRTIARKHRKPLVVNVAPTSSEPAEESFELVARAYNAGADAVMLNAACPNLPSADGGRHKILSSDPTALENVLQTLQPVTEEFRKIFVRVTPQETFGRTLAVVQAIKRAGTVSAISVSNTIPTTHPVIDTPGNICGKSGSAVAEEGRRQTQWFDTGDFDIISSLGIATGEELRRRIKIGNGNRVVAGAGTTVFWEDPDWREAVGRILWDYHGGEV